MHSADESLSRRDGGASTIRGGVSMPNYVIQGGKQGRERLRLLSAAMWPATSRLLDGVGLEAGMNCLDVGCGGGDVTRELARRVGERGRVLGLDLDEPILQLARDEARREGLGNIEFQRA